MTISRELAKRTTAMRYEDLPAEAVYWSRVAVLDTVGVTLAGAREEAAEIVEDVLESAAGPSLVFGTTRRVRALDAALVNGTAAHALDFDNATNTMFGHVSATVIPALLAAAEAYGGSGRDVLLAHVAGFEVGARLGRAVNMHHYTKGWHPTSTLGAMAVAAACARLLNLDVEKTATALAISTSLASGIKANFGSMTKPLHVGHCAHDGLLAALLARKGYTANAEAFEHKQGFFNVYDGAEHVDVSRVLENWAAPLDIVAPGACYKQYPCCASTHAAVDAALALVNEHGRLAPEAVESIQSWTSPRRLIHTNRPEPATALDAKFSIQYCIGRALVTGSVLFEHFEGDAHREPAVRKMTSRVHATTFESGEFEPGNDVGAKLMVTLNDGRTLSTKIERPVGRRADNAIAHESLQAKFRSCARRVLSDEATAAALEKIERFETLSSMHELTDVLARGVRDA
jgi:2-methylcitrate dehydratase PrpD